MNIFTFLKIAAEFNPQQGTEIRSVAASIRNRVNRVRAEVESSKSNKFNSSPGTQGPVGNFSNPQPASAPGTNINSTGPASSPANPQVQQFQNNFAPATNAPPAPPAPAAPKLFTPR